MQRLITQALRAGIPEGEAGRRISASVDTIRKMTEPWADSYSRMVFRTNLNAAVTAGRFRQLRDPDVKEVIPALRFDAVGDADTRANHGAADGVILRVDNPAWQSIAPPLGYSCRCQVSLVSVAQLKRMRRLGPSGAVIESKIPEGAGPDPGFRHSGRPDI